jgi:hypothetical protein
LTPHQSITSKGIIENPKIAEMSLDPRVSINNAQVEKIAQVIADFPFTSAFNFLTDYLPPLDHPHALNYFFAITLQQFGFWRTKNGHYHEPLVATMDSRKMKGSTYLFHAYTRLLESDPTFFTPQRQANLQIEDLMDTFRDDDGEVQMPAIDLHLRQAHKYGQSMLEYRLTPYAIVEHAQSDGTTLFTFLGLMGVVGGYNEDPLWKKANLLALILNQRPEAFLTFAEDEMLAPIVDYHCMRSILRIGMINVQDEQLAHKLTYRLIVSEEQEWAVRLAAYRVIKRLVEGSGQPVSVVDNFLFGYMRTHCPEMSEPICSECVLDEICAKRKEMFQPVIRTTYY